MKKSSIDGNRYLLYLCELSELPVNIYWWCWRFAAPDSLRSVHSENQGFFITLKVFTHYDKKSLYPHTVLVW